MKRVTISRFSAVVWFIAIVCTTRAYVLDGGPYWADGTVAIELKLPASPTYSDGSNASTTAREAAKLWNPYMGRVQLETTAGSAGQGASKNSISEVFFSQNVYGTAFGSDVLAVTVTWTSGNRRSESDVVVNQAESWDSYRGYLRNTPTDLRRVLAHEFGHVLGLGHVTTWSGVLMSPYVGDIEGPTKDEQDGAAALYGYGVANPPVPPVLSSNTPYDVTATVGEAGTFSTYLNYDASRPLTYQWRKDGVDILGATSESLSFASVKLTDAGNYSVVITNPAATVTSRAARLTVNPPQLPQFNSYAPADVTSTIGKTVSFYASISSGTSPFTYQWRKNGVAIPGATQSSHQITSLTLADAGLYSVVVTNAAGSVTSREATLVINPPVLPTVSQSTTPATSYLGSSVSLDCYVSAGTDPFIYQWEKEGVPVTGATNSYLSLSNLTAAQAGAYTVVVTNAAGSVRSNPRTLMILPVPFPAENTISLSYSTSYQLQVSSYYSNDFGPQTYLWYRDGQLITGATNSYYDIPLAQRNMPADYVVLVANSAGATPSRAFSYTPPAIASTPTVGGWIAVERFGDLVYFLFPNPARIERYDLVQDKWLATIALARTPTALRPDPAGLFVAFGKSVSRFNADGTGETAITTTEQDVNALFVRNGILYVFYPQSYVYTFFKSVRLSDNTVLDSKSYIYSMSMPGSVSFAPTLGKFFGRDSGLSPADIHVITCDASGAFIEEKNSPYHGSYPDAKRTFVSPDEKFVYEDSGTVYRAADLTFAGSVGSNFDDVAFADDGTTIVLRGGRLVAFDNKLAESGHLSVTGTPSRMYIAGQTVVLFAPPSGSGTATTVTRVPRSQFAARAALARVSADALAYTPSEIILGADNIVYLLSRAHGNIFRWSVAEKRYLESFPLLGLPNFLTASADTSALYLAYGDKRITRLAVAAGAEQPFFSTGAEILGLGMAGDYVFLNDNTSPWTSYYTINSSGSVVSSTAWKNSSHSFVWSETKRRVYHLSGSELLFTEVAADGTLGAAAETSNSTNFDIRYPLCLSPNTGTVLLGSGVFFDPDTLAKNNALPVAVDDATWLGARLYTARNTLDGVRVERWGGNNYGLDANGNVAGRLLRLLALPDNRLLLIVLRDKVPTFIILDAELGGADPLAPRLLTQPSSSTAAAGGEVTLTASAFGGSLSYQWQKDGIDVPGATSTTLALHNLTSADVGAYSLAARNSAGVVVSSVVNVALANFAFAGTWFGSIPGGAGEFALVVRSDGSNVLLARLAASPQAIVAMGLRFSDDGAFTWTAPVGGLHVAGGDDVRFSTAAISGRIAGDTLTLQLPSVSIATATRSTPGADTDRAGFYQGVPMVRSSGELFIALGHDGRAFVLEVGTRAARSTIASTWIPTLASTLGDTPPAFDPRLVCSLDSGLSTATAIDGALSAGGFRGTVTTGANPPVSLVPPPMLPGRQRLANISARGLAGNGDKTLIAGFVVTGNQAKEVLVRAIGPALVPLGVSGALANPTLTLYRGSTSIFTNDDWGFAGSDISTIGARLGAFALPSGSRDSALLARLDPGIYTAHVGLSGGAAGIAMIEVYDAGGTERVAPKVVNISTRADVGRADNILIAGFVVSGDAPKKILLRGIGPALTAQGVSGALVDPQLKVFDPSTLVAQNDNWEDADNGALIAAAAAKVGAFALPPGSKDASMLLYLKPGAYTVQVSGVNDTTGVAMVEVYEVTD